MRPRSAVPCLCAVFAGALAAIAADGGGRLASAPEFGGAGVVPVTVPDTEQRFGDRAANPPEVRDALVDRSGRVVILVSNAWSPWIDELVLVGSQFVARDAALVERRTADGALDPSFGDGGVVALPENRRWFSVALDLQDRVVLLGLDRAAELPVLMRLDTSGSPDLQFGAGGLSQPTGGTRGRADQVAVDAAGGIVVAGQTGLIGSTELRHWQVFRVQEDGALDPAFGDAGIRRILALTGQQMGPCMALDPRGGIVVAGPIGWLQSLDPLVRLTADGQDDPAFELTPDPGVRSVLAWAAGVAVDDIGRIVATSEQAVVRLAEDGATDPAWGWPQAPAVSLRGNAWDRRHPLTLSPAGGPILVTTWSSDISGLHRTLVELDSRDGSLIAVHPWEAGPDRWLSPAFVRAEADGTVRWGGACFHLGLDASQLSVGAHRLAAFDDTPRADLEVAWSAPLELHGRRNRVSGGRRARGRLAVRNRGALASGETQATVSRWGAEVATLRVRPLAPDETVAIRVRLRKRIYRKGNVFVARVVDPGAAAPDLNDETTPAPIPARK